MRWQHSFTYFCKINNAMYSWRSSGIEFRFLDDPSYRCFHYLQERHAPLALAGTCLQKLLACRKKTIFSGHSSVLVRVSGGGGLGSLSSH